MLKQYQDRIRPDKTPQDKICLSASTSTSPTCKAKSTVSLFLSGFVYSGYGDILHKRNGAFIGSDIFLYNGLLSYILFVFINVRSRVLKKWFLTCGTFLYINKLIGIELASWVLGIDSSLFLSNICQTNSVSGKCPLKVS